MQQTTARVRIPTEARQSEIVTAVLALTVRPALTDEARCSRLMRDVQMDESKYALAGFIPLDGQMRLAGARATDEHHVVRGLEERA